jgi:hypothetical protein
MLEGRGDAGTTRRGRTDRSHLLVALLPRLLVPELRRAAAPNQAVEAWTVEASRVSALEDR